MNIAVLSDIHDNIWNLETALGLLSRDPPEALFFLGDFCAPFTLKQLAEGYSSGPIHAVLGNNDGDPLLLASIASGFAHVHLHGPYAELEIGGLRVALNHFPDIARRIAQSGELDAVFSGHDHQKYTHRFGDTLWANPGEIMGRFGEPGFGSFDTDSRSFEHIPLAPRRPG